MRASCDYHPWYPNVDPDFDGWGGELTLHQIADPVPEGDEDPAPYFARKRAREYEARNYARSLERAQALQAAKQAAHKQVRKSQGRLAALVARFDVGARSLNKACNGCIPYNGTYTLKYWNPTSKPYRVEDFLR